MKLFPILAMLFAHVFTTDIILKMYNQLVEDIANQDYSKMDLLHHLTAGGKSVCTQDCQNALYTIRQSLGGAGYSAWSGIPYLIDDYSPEVTYEGDNTVMAQQSFNYLKKQIQKAKTAKVSNLGFFDYLNELPTLVNLKCKARDFTYFLNVGNIHEVLKVNLSVKVLQIQELMQTNKASKKDFTNLHFAAEIVDVSTSHFKYLMFWNFLQRVSGGSIKCQNLQKHL